jgi:trimethylamine:corrinoid methyltransferase-like protein
MYPPSRDLKAAIQLASSQLGIREAMSDGSDPEFVGVRCTVSPMTYDKHATTVACL